MRLRVHPMPGARLVDFEATLRATAGVVRFGDTKEGLMAIRVATPMAEINSGKMEDARGRSYMRQIFGQEAEWCHYAGRIGEAVVGISFFDHPGNPHHPCRWFARNYGLLAANPFGARGLTRNKELDGALDLPSGKSLTLRYRLRIHEGDAAAGNTALHYASYAHPPKVVVEK
jgi:hypothetical protein